MLAGHPPFEGATASDVMVAVLDREPVPLAVLAPDTPPVLRDAVSRALAKDRDGRYANVADIARQLEALRRELDRSWGEPPPAPAEAPDGAPMPERAGAAAGTIVARHVRRWPALLALALIVASGGVWLVGREWTAREGASENRDRPLDQKYVVAVLPFESLSADTAKGYIAAGMTEEVTSQLSRLSALRVLSRAALAPYRSTTDRLPRMVRELGVGSVVEGSVRAEGDRARIAVQLIDARSGQAIWSQQYDRQLSDVFAVQRQVAQSITGALEATLTPEEARRAGRPPTVNLEAYELYMRAQRAPGGNLEQHTTATQMLRRAIALDSTFARAYVALGRRYLFMGYMNPAYQDSGLIAVRRAVAVDPNSADAHHMLGNLQGESGQLMVSKASLLKALDLAPSLQFAYNDLSITLDILGEYDQALHWAVRGAPLAPTNPVTYYHVGVPLLRLGDDATVERYLVDAEQRFKGFPRLHIQLAHLDVLRGRHGAALDRARQLAAKYPRSEEVQLALAEVAVIARAPDAEALAGSFAATAPEARAVILPESMRTLHAWTLAASGRRAEADALWNEALATAQRDVERGNGKPDRPMEIAAIHAVHGDTAAALEWLERGYRTGFKDYRILALDPFFDGLRVHPQFRRIAARMQAEVTEMRRRAAAVHDTLFTARRVGDATAAVAPSGAR
jgi:TolB-like protein/Flp pilus assembly protein TadD